MRPSRWLQRAAALGLLVAVAGPAVAVETKALCGDGLDARARRLIDGPSHWLAYAPRPAPITTGRHFALDIVVCPKAGAGVPLALRVDAQMPAHSHGMNYRPTVRALGPTGDAGETRRARYRADGLLLHMTGQWRLVFEFSADGRPQRLTQDLDLP